MDDRYRFLSTAAIWVAFALVLMTLFISMAAGGAQLDGPVLIPLTGFVAILTIVAGLATMAVWRGAGQSGAASAQDVQKAKRVQSSRIARLMEQLDEDEMIELETLLLARQDDPNERR
jgi:hypothetical protein